MDLHNTLGIEGIPHGESIAKFMSTKTCQITRNPRKLANKSSNPRTPKTPKSSPLTHGFGRGIKGFHTEKNHEGFTHTTPTKSPRARSRKCTKESTKRGLRKSLPTTNRDNTTKPWGTTPNHQYIPKRFIQGLACCPIIQPSHKISPWCSQVSPIEILGKIWMENKKTKWARVPRDGCNPLTSWVIWRHPKV
jgi:hypothetical protein